MAQRDVLVIGSGPGGQKAAIQAVKLGCKVTLFEKHARPGGFCTHTGTIPSKSLREAARFAHALETNLRHQEAQKSFLETTFERTLSAICREEDIAADQLHRNGVEFVCGHARFRSANELEVEHRGTTTIWKAPIIVIATGSRPVHPEGVVFNPQGPIYDSDTILGLQSLPETLVVEGGGVIGSEYACIFHHLGVHVTLVNRHPTILHFLDNDVRERLEESMRSRGITLVMSTKITEYNLTDEGVHCVFDDGGSARAESALICSGRRANIGELDLDKAGVKETDHNTIEVDQNYQTTVPGIYAVGDVTGFPSLAAAALTQGRIAIRHAIEKEPNIRTPLIPMGVWTIPEIGSVGATERELQNDDIPYVVGEAPFDELARAQLDVNPEGYLKILFCPETHRIHGVHGFGRGACELVYPGQLAMSLGGPVDTFIDNPSNFPTYSGVYKVAAINGLNTLRAGTPESTS